MPRLLVGWTDQVHITAAAVERIAVLEADFLIPSRAHDGAVDVRTTPDLRAAYLDSLPADHVAVAVDLPPTAHQLSTVLGVNEDILPAVLQ